jgi:hypothetical protein
VCGEEEAEGYGSLHQPSLGERVLRLSEDGKKYESPKKPFYIWHIYSRLYRIPADVAQLVEQRHGKA